jgi:hypothetical protein
LAANNGVLRQQADGPPGMVLNHPLNSRAATTVPTSVTQDRADARLAWTRNALTDAGATLEPASADASFRSYWRVTRSEGTSLVLMDAPPSREDVRPWLDVAGRLEQAGVAAPRVLDSDAQHGFVLMQDLGSATLLPALDERSVDTLYARAMALLLHMQRQVDASGLPRYDEPRLVAEMELMPEWFLRRHLGFAPDCDQWDEVELAFRALANAALAQPTVFVHRDFHSRNLMLQPDGSLAAIDFQDAVRGPVTYDLVSLLRDCYIAWPEQWVYRWVDEYRGMLVESGVADVDAAGFRRWFDLMGLQRHIKVLGIFCRLWYRDGKAGYLGDLPLVWRYTREVGLRYPDVAPLVRLVERALDGRDLRVPAA